MMMFLKNFLILFWIFALLLFIFNCDPKSSEPKPTKIGNYELANPQTNISALIGRETEFDLNITGGDVSEGGGLELALFTYSVEPALPEGITLTNKADRLILITGKKAVLQSPIAYEFKALIPSGNKKFFGSFSGKFTVAVVRPPLAGELSYSPRFIKLNPGQTDISVLSLANVTAGSKSPVDFKYRVNRKGDPSLITSISISSDGTLTFTDQLKIEDSGEYIITAEAQKNNSHSGFLTAEISLDIQNKKNVAGNIQVNDIGLKSGIEKKMGFVLSITAGSGSQQMKDYRFSVAKKGSDDKHPVSLGSDGSVIVDASFKKEDEGVYILKAICQPFNTHIGEIEKEFNISFLKVAGAINFGNKNIIATRGGASPVIAVSAINLSGITDGTKTADAYDFKIVNKDNGQENPHITINADGKIEVKREANVMKEQFYVVTATANSKNSHDGQFNIDISITVDARPKLAGTIQFPGGKIETKVGIAADLTIDISGITAGSKDTSDYDFTIVKKATGQPVAGVTIDNGGKVTVSASTSGKEDGVYTVKATAKLQNTHSGVLPAELTLEFKLVAGNISFDVDPIEETRGGAKLVIKQSTIDLSKITKGSTTVSEYNYAIVRKDTGLAVAHITIDQDGIISVAREAVATDKRVAYVVTATAKPIASHGGSLTLELPINIKSRPDVQGKIGFGTDGKAARLETKYGTAKSIDVYLDDITSGSTKKADYDYTIKKKDGSAASANIVVDRNGKLTVEKSAAISEAGEYILTATAKIQNTHKGSFSKSIVISIDNVTGIDFTIASGLVATVVTTNGDAPHADNIPTILVGIDGATPTTPPGNGLTYKMELKTGEKELGGVLLTAADKNTFNITKPNYKAGKSIYTVTVTGDDITYFGTVTKDIAVKSIYMPNLPTGSSKNQNDIPWGNSMKSINMLGVDNGADIKAAHYTRSVTKKGRGVRTKSKGYGFAINVDRVLLLGNSYKITFENIMLSTANDSGIAAFFSVRGGGLSKKNEQR